MRTKEIVKKKGGVKEKRREEKATIVSFLSAAQWNVTALWSTDGHFCVIITEILLVMHATVNCLKFEFELNISCVYHSNIAYSWIQLSAEIKWILFSKQLLLCLPFEPQCSLLVSYHILVVHAKTLTSKLFWKQARFTQISPEFNHWFIIGWSFPTDEHINNSVTTAQMGVGSISDECR